MNARYALSVLPGIALALAPPPAPHELSFSPAPGTSLVKRIVRESDVALDVLEIRIAGKDLSDTVATTDVGVRTTSTVEVTDRYEDVREERVDRLRRSFDRLETSTRLSLASAALPELEDIETRGSSALQGRAVVCTREAEDWKIEWADGQPASSELLSGLHAELDFAGLLPPGQVQVGDAWQVEPRHLRAVFAPGGDLLIRPELDDGSPPPKAPPSLEQMLGELTGRVEATLDVVEMRGGERIATVLLDVDLQSEKDLRDVADRFLPELPEAVRFDVDSLDSRLSFQGPGRLVWSLERGHLLELELSGKIDVSIRQVAQLRSGGVQQELDQTLSLTGEHKVKVVFEN